MLLGERVDVSHPSEAEDVLAQRMEDVPDDLGDALHQAAQEVVAVVVAPLDVGHGVEVRCLVHDRRPGALLGRLSRLRMGRDIRPDVGVGGLGEPDRHAADADDGPAPYFQPSVGYLLVCLSELLSLRAGASRVRILAQSVQKRFGAAYEEVLLRGDPA